MVPLNYTKELPPKNNSKELEPDVEGARPDLNGQPRSEGKSSEDQTPAQARAQIEAYERERRGPA